MRFDAGGEGCRFIPVDGMDSLFVAMPCKHRGSEQAVAEHSDEIPNQQNRPYYRVKLTSMDVIFLESIRKNSLLRL
ncbi:hypothetical protein [Mesorhizobium sanjuanii]|uniref:hypothetical protein n=1 Tax=Mesorhizobium sanjuanii TaxID=2037900 RepID=UPI001055F6B1|nr:hypothetical protein [Mesorhizobium sanjuanii]